jgi:hypothetical protein
LIFLEVDRMQDKAAQSQAKRRQYHELNPTKENRPKLVGKNADVQFRKCAAYISTGDTNY